MRRWRTSIGFFLALAVSAATLSTVPVSPVSAQQGGAVGPCVAGAPSIGDEILADSPLAYWPFPADDPLTDVIDGRTITTPAGFDLESPLIPSLSGPAIRIHRTPGNGGTPPVFGSANGAGILPSGDFSIEFWSQVGSVNTFKLGTGDQDPLQGMRIGWPTDFGGIEANIEMTGVDGYFDAVPTFSFQLHHYVVQREGTQLTIFRDGRITTNPQGESGAMASGDVVYANSLIRFPNGVAIDEFAIYDNALGQARITAHYEAGACDGSGTDPLGIGGVTTGDVIVVPFSDPVAADHPACGRCH